MKLTGKKNPVWKLDTQVAELESSLETVKVLLEQQSPTVDEAQQLLKVSPRPCVILYPITSFSSITASYRRLVHIRPSSSCSSACVG